MTMTTTEAEVLTPETVKQEALTLPQQAEQFAVIRTHDEYAQAGAVLTKIKTMRKKLADVFGPITDAAHKAWKVALGQKQEAEKPLDVAEAHIKRLLIAYDQEQERIRQEAQRAAEAAARKQEEDRRLAEAAAVEASGDHAEAEAMLAEPVVAPVVVVERTTPKVAGVSMKENWTFEITDANAIPREFLAVDEAKIRGVVRAMKGATKIPGVRAYAQQIVSARG